MSDIPPIRNNDYKSVVIIVAGLSISVNVCRGCGSMVFDKDVHKQWHKKHDR